MTSKERWRAAAARRPVDRITLDYWGTGEMTAKLRAFYQVQDDAALWKAMGIDKGQWIWSDVNDPYAAERDGADLWWIKRRVIEYHHGAGSYDEVCFSPLAALETVAELERFRWPDPRWWDFSKVAERAVALKDQPIQGGSFEPFYLYSQMRGIELAMEDVAERPEFLEYALQRIFEIHYAINEGQLKAAGGAVDYIYVAEDLGSQESLLMSPKAIRTFFLPRMKKMIDLAHRHGAFAFHHDDGAIFDIVPLLLDAGIDILNPIQWRCQGMDRRALKRAYGNQVCFHGAMDNQQTLPFGTEAQIRAEVRENLEIFGTTGYILAPCHNVQPITNPAHLAAMYEEAKAWKG